MSCEFVLTLTITHSEVEALGVVKDDSDFPRVTLRRYDIIISVIFFVNGPGAAILVRTRISMCGAPASKASVAGRYNRDLPIPDSGRRRVSSVMKRAHLPANERPRSNPNSHD